MLNRSSFLSLSMGVLLGLSFAAPAVAADQALLDILLGNGVITQDQYDLLMEKEKLEAKDLMTAVPAPTPAPAIPAAKPVMSATVGQKGFSINSDDGFSFALGGRLHVDASLHSEDTVGGAQVTDGTEFRRSRLVAKGKLYHDWAYTAEVDFADNDVSVKDFFLGYNGFKGTKLYLGHVKQPYSLMLESSSNDLPFVERSIDNDLIAPFVDRAIGARAEVIRDHTFFAAGIFGESIAANKDDDEGWGASARYVWAPVIEKTRAIHTGVRAAWFEPTEASESIRIRSETAHLSNLFLANTGTISDVSGVSIVGLEGGFATGAFSAGGEWSQLEVNRSGAPNDLSFDSWHVYATWSLTGESRAASYKISSGEFKRLKPKQMFSRETGGIGAWELAFRYASLDLNDGSFIGGSEQALTAGINWYATPTIRFLLDYTTIVDTEGASTVLQAADGLNIFQLRAQYTF